MVAEACSAHVFFGVCFSNMDIFNIIVGIASLIGLVISIFVLSDTKKIREFFLHKARLPELFTDLQNSYNELDNFLKTNSIDKCHKVIMNTKPIISSLEQKGKYINNVKSYIDEYKLAIDCISSSSSTDEYWDCATKLSTLIVSLKQMDKDLKWG